MRNVVLPREVVERVREILRGTVGHYPSVSIAQDALAQVAALDAALAAPEPEPLLNREILDEMGIRGMQAHLMRVDGDYPFHRDICQWLVDEHLRLTGEATP